ncbi:hypothetical protein GGR54DRAFT_642510 [Hypoxylon sp. NC1633]|nr:hypothetical protein GGR54DRAFT_642510 [Hypoxylon sp. NC1633]
MNTEDDAPPAYTRFPEQAPDEHSSDAPSWAPALPPRTRNEVPVPARTSFPTPPTPATPRTFPVSWTLYRGSASGAYHIAADADPGSPPLYAVTQTPSPSAGQPNLTLHSGPRAADPALATGDRHKSFAGGVHSAITLPGSGSGISPEEPLRTVVSWPHISYAFDADVGGGVATDPAPLGSLRRETFEWRHSAGSAVASLGAAASGWKLIRTTTDPPPGIGEDAWPFAGGGEMSSDGKEIVAVWADARRSPAPDVLMKFRFLGMGASGVLGERWATMAVMSALRMWQQGEMARRTSETIEEIKTGQG